MRSLFILFLFPIFLFSCDNQKKDRPSEKNITFLKCNYAEFDIANGRGLNYLKIADILMFKDSDMYATTLSIYDDATFTRKKSNFANTLNYFSEKYLVFNIAGQSKPPQFILNRFTLEPTYLSSSNRITTDSKDKQRTDIKLDEKLKGITGKSFPFVNSCEKVIPPKKQI